MVRMLTAGLLLFGLAAWAGDGPVPNAAAARAQAIRATLDTLDVQLKAHGGTWEKWAEGLKDYRADLNDCLKAKWPWPAKDNFVFYGASAQLLKMDDLDAQAEGLRPYEPIVSLDRQLKALGIDLILVLIPSKLNIYPDYLLKDGQPVRAPEDRMVNVPVKRLMKRLLENDVEVLDLYTAFAAARKELEGKAQLYYTKDGHWKNLGCRLASDKIAERLKRYDFVQEALAKGNPYSVKQRSRDDGNKADGDVHGIWNEKANGAYRDVGSSPVIMTGDSFSMYNMPDGHFSAQVAQRIGLPLTLLCKEGLSYEAPVRLAAMAKDGGLKGRRVVLWTFNDCMFMLKAPNKWPIVELAPSAGGAEPKKAEAQVAGVLASGVVGEASPPPKKDAPYPNYFVLAYLKDLVDENGKPVGSGDGVVHVLAMHQRKLLPSAALKKGDKLQVKLTAWPGPDQRLTRVQSGMLPTVALDTDKTHYLGEIPGAPALTDGDLKKAGESD